MEGVDIDLNRPASDDAEERINIEDRNVVIDCGRDFSLREMERKLVKGNTFQSMEHAYVFYVEYGRKAGFSIKRANQDYFFGTKFVRQKLFLCSCHGVTDRKRSVGRVAKYRKQERRCSCSAKLRVAREAMNSPWIVMDFVKEHTHDLFEPDQCHLIRSARHLNAPSKQLLETMNSSGIGVSKACNLMGKQAGGIQNIGFTKKDAYDHMSRTRSASKLPNADANALLLYFIDKTKVDPLFYWNVMLDEEGRLMNFYFRDGRCLLDYDSFGDVLSVDTTFKTNKYNLICAPFVGMNHHRQNLMFAMAFLCDETTTSFKWLFTVFLESMYGREPQIIFSDQSQALMNGIDYCFKSAKPRLCQWHLNHNLQNNFAKMAGHSIFKSLWYKCMHQCESEVEFETTWQMMMQQFSLHEKPWFKTTYELRKRWASVFTNDRFSGGLHATSRSEAANRVLKTVCSRSSTLQEVVLRYDELLKSNRLREREEDALCIGMPGQIIDNNALMTHAARVYTRSVYKFFEAEAINVINTKIVQHPANISADVLDFLVYCTGEGSRYRTVNFNQRLLTVECSCCMWETTGIFCRHIVCVLGAMNVDNIPDYYILKRWTRNARRPLHDYSQRPSGMETCSHIMFTTNIMRMTYSIVQECIEDVGLRAIIERRISDLRMEVCGVRDERPMTDRYNHTTPQDIPTARRFNDPPVAKHMWYPARRTTGKRGTRKSSGKANRVSAANNRGERNRCSSLRGERSQSMFASAMDSGAHHSQFNVHFNQASVEGTQSYMDVPTQSSQTYCFQNPG